MCTKKELDNAENSQQSDDYYISDSDGTLTEFASDSSIDEAESDNEVVEADGNVEEESEDELINKIRQECRRKRDHPPPIICEEFVVDISFHPHENILSAADIGGDVTFYKYTNEENSILKTLELHTKSCRDIEFSADGDLLFSTARDKLVMISNVETGKLVQFYEDAHEVPVYCLCIIDENIFATGDDDGTIKLWDRRIKKQIYKTKKNFDYISDMVTNEGKKYLIAASGDGSLTTLDLQHRKVHMQSEEYEEELTCLGLFRSETKLLSCSSRGKYYLYNWNEFGLHSDMFPGTKFAVNDIIPITENIVVAASEDGILRATHLFPHRHLGVVGQHSLSVERLDICNTGEFIASCSHDNDIKFWNIKYFENMEKVSHKHKKHKRNEELQNNLPSSKIQNGADFFSDLC